MPGNGELTNPEIITIVVFKLGGLARSIDTEDVAMLANRVAPRRFTWRKYPAQINLQGVRFALEDAKKPQCAYALALPETRSRHRSASTR